MIPAATKFRKVILLLKDLESKDKDILSTIRIEHDDCAMIITGSYVIITEEENNNEIDTPEIRLSTSATARPDNAPNTKELPTSVFSNAPRISNALPSAASADAPELIIKKIVAKISTKIGRIRPEI